MKIFLIVMGSLIGFFALIIGVLFFLWFYQGGCCVKKIKNKFSSKVRIDNVVEKNN
jgi:hypothetical protein